jgi:hypothetical protein
MMLRRAMLVIVLLALLASAAAGAANPGLLPVAVIKKLAADELAGKTVDQAVWARPVSIPRFEYYVTDYLPTQQTEVRLAYDDSNLYVAYHCLDDPSRLKTEVKNRDEEVWRDDAVGIDLDLKHDHETFYRLWSNSVGLEYDAAFLTPGLRQGDTSWNAEWTAVGAKCDDGWKLLMTIPFKSLGLSTPKPGTMWGVNLARRSTPAFERSCWAQCRAPIQDVPVWGHFLFEGPDSPIVYIEPSAENRDAEFYPCRDRCGGNIGHAATPIAVPGPHPLKVKILNPASKPLSLRLDVLIDNKVNASHRTTAAPGASDWDLRFDFPFEGLHELKFAVYDDKNNLLMCDPYQLVLVPEHTKRLAQYENLVRATIAANDATSAEKANIVKILSDLAVFGQSARGNLESWKKLGSKLDEVSLLIQHLRCACADKSNLGYAVGVETALTKIMRDEMFQGEFGKPASMTLAKNEWESVQVCVLAHEKPLKDVKVTVSELRGPNGAVIPSGSIRTNLVDWVDCKPARYAADLYGWVPDPLMDMDTFDVDKGALKPVWITVHSPENIPAGDYTGTVTVKPADMEATRIPIVATVWDFAIPTRCHAKTAFTHSEGDIPTWYGKPFTEEQRLQWYDFLLDHHISPTNIYASEGQPSKEYIPYCVERGMNSFNMTCTWYKSEKDLDKMEPRLRDMERFLKDRGWWDMPYVYGFDELGPEKYQELRDTYGGLHKRFPDLKTMTTSAPQPEMKGYVDIWVPLTAFYVHDVAEQYRKSGDQVWWYVCCSPPHPWPNYFTDYNAIDPRVLWWMSWKEDCPGILYYYMENWETNRKLEDDKKVAENDWEKAILAGKRWPEVKWNTHTCATFNGDGQLLYPGPKGNPIASIRLVSIRDGIEDYEYLYILNDLIKQAEKKPGVDKAMLARAKKLVAVRDDVAKSPTEYSTDPAVLLGARAELAEMIQKLK